MKAKSWLIYNPDHRKTVTISLSANIPLRENWVQCLGAEASVSTRNITITMKTAGCCFSKTTITDANNHVSYNIKVCILDLQPRYLETIQTSYLLSVSQYQKHCAIQVLGIGKTLLINPNQVHQERASLADHGLYTCNFDHTLVLSVDDESIPPDSGVCSITLKCGAVEIPLQIKDESSKMVGLTGLDVLRWKYQERKPLEYRGDKLVSGTSAFYIRKEAFRTALAWEDWMLQNQVLAADLTVNGLVEHPLRVSDSVRQAYLTLLETIKARRQLPSLAAYTDQVKEAAEAYVKTVSAAFDAIPSGESLEATQSDLLLLGCILRKCDEHAILMSPLHPLNVQYQLSLLEEKEIDKARDQILEKLTPLNLLPYIRDEERRLYLGIEQTDSPEWRFYVQASNKRYQGGRQFVERLVGDKIREYQKNFPFLFEEIGNNQLRINLVNMGDGREVLQGLIRYYAQQLNQGVPPEDLNEFIINIYGDLAAYSEFFILSDQNKMQKYIEDYRNNIDSSEMATILAGRIKCYFRSLKEESYEYAHLTFYEMNSSSDLISSRMENIPTGISLGGLTSGVPSVLDGSWYKTGFGTRYAPKNDLVNMAVRYNALHHVAFLGSAYRPEDCIFTEIEHGQENLLNKIYQASNWVVFVSPKVDLSFFQKKRADEDGLMIIHYSDQYTSSNGYDDITVTQKSKQYREIILEQMKKRNVSASSDQINHVINLFNAVNGNWLLKLFRQRSEITAKSAQLYEDLLDQASGELPLCLIPDLLEEICGQAEKEREQEITESALAKISKISEQFLLQFQTEASSIERFVAFAKERTGEEYIEPIYNLSNQAWVQAKHLYEVQLEKERKNASELAKQLKKLQNKLGEIDNYLSVDIDERAISRIYKQIKKLEQTQMDLNAQLEYKQKKRVSLHSEAIRANTEYSRYVESALKSLELSDDSGRIITYSQKAISLLKKYRVCLQENKIRLLAETMTECYHKLASKKNLIDKITMDPVTLDFQYTNEKGDVIPKTSLSAGEMQLMVISLLWSLALSSKWKLPVII